MRKIFVAASIVAVALSGYSAVWYYGATEIKKTIAGRIEENNQQKKEFFLSYDSINVTGFPAGYHIAINAPKLEQKEVGPDITSVNLTIGKVVLTSNLLRTDYTLTAIGDAEETYINKGKKESFLFQFPEAPLLTVRLKDTDSFKKILKNNDTLLEEIQELRYVDAGLKIIDGESKETNWTVEPTFFNIDNIVSSEGRKITTIKFDMKGIEGNLDKKLLLPKLIGKTAVSADISVMQGAATQEASDVSEENKKKASEEKEFVITKLELSSGRVNVALQGKVYTSPHQFMPSGELNIAVQEVPLLLEYLASVKLIENADRTQYALKKMQENTASDKDMNFVVKGNSSGMITVGALSLQEVLALFNSGQ